MTHPNAKKTLLTAKAASARVSFPREATKSDEKAYFPFFDRLRHR
jgi:hypothetical protein